MIHVQVSDRTGKVIHTYPIVRSSENREVKDVEYFDDAITCAIRDKLVLPEDAKGLRCVFVEIL